MVHYYISSYIYHIYIYLKTKTKKLQVFRVWDLTGIHDSVSPHFISTMENKYKAKVASEENLSNLTVLQ